MTNIRVTIEGDKEFAEAMSKLPDELLKSIQAAGEEATKEILETVGIETYPPITAANLPPAPYYDRGKGTVYPSGRSDNSSEQYGKQWQPSVSEGYKTVTKNTASYGKYLVSDEEQARHMARIGWRRLGKVALEKKDKILEIYDGWIQRAIERLGL